MLEFRIIKKSKKTKARIGILKTEHGVIQTPCLVPVATQGVIKTLDSQEVAETKSQVLIANTFHLHLKPGENIIAKSGGLHQFMNWNSPLMTDSGGFQVFSLGFGRDFNIGKILRYFPGNNTETIKKIKQPRNLKITADGVYFKSLLDGKELFLGPKESIKIQEKLGADIIFTFDECTPPLAEREYIEKSLERTHNWAKICQKEHKTQQALFGIVQGSRFKDLREESAKFINSLDFDGFGVGGDLGKDKNTMLKIISWVLPFLDEKKLRHLLGIGKIEDIENIIKAGIDLFDCTVPTHYARRGIAFINKPQIGGRRASPEYLNLAQAKFLNDKKPLDKNCDCYVCQNYKRNYICHLLRAKEITALKLLTFHNLYFFNSFVKGIRERIENGEI